MKTAAPPSPAVLDGLLDLRPSLGLEPTAPLAEDALAQALATVGVYEFTSADYPGAAQSLVWDSDGTTALGAFVFNPGGASSAETAFTVAGGVYQILNVPNSTISIATGINKDGLIVGTYQDLAGVIHGFTTSDGTTFSNVDFPSAKGTQAIGVSDAGDIVGLWNDAAGTQHGFLGSGGTFTAIDFPGSQHHRGRRHQRQRRQRRAIC